DDDRGDDPRRAGRRAPRVDHRLSHQRPRLEDARGAAGHPERPARARVPVRAPLGVDARWRRPGGDVRPDAAAVARPGGRCGPLAMVRFARPTAALARAQSSWIAAIEPWRGLGYRAEALGRYLGRKARAGAVWIARATPRGAPLAIAVVDDGVLLG